MPSNIPILDHSRARNEAVDYRWVFGLATPRQIIFAGVEADTGKQVNVLVVE